MEKNNRMSTQSTEDDAQDTSTDTAATANANANDAATEDTPKETQPKDRKDDDRSGGDKRHLAELASERRKRQQLERELQALKDRDLTELQRAQKEAREAQQKASQLEKDSIRQRVALKHGIPVGHVHRILGDTEEDMDADAKTLATDLRGEGRRPAPDHSQGSRGGDVSDMNSLIRLAAGRR